VANSYRLETLRGTAAINGLQTATLISDLSRTMNLLTTDSEHEEARAGVRDVSDPTYPVLARSLRALRRTGQASRSDAIKALRKAGASGCGRTVIAAACRAMGASPG